MPGFERPREKLLERGSRALSGAKLLVLLLRAKRTKCVQIFTFDAKIQGTLSLLDYALRRGPRRGRSEEAERTIHYRGCREFMIF